MYEGSNNQRSVLRMTEGKPFLLWPGADDRIVVEEMLRDSRSGQWYECREFVKKCVQTQATNIPQDHWEDIVQDAMIRVDKSLLTFHYQCTLRTWIFVIVRNGIIDAYRKFTHVGQFIAPLHNPRDDVECEGNAFTANTPNTVEDECITHDDLQKALAALQDYVFTHANPIRNGRILDIVIFEGRSLEEAAKAVGCSAPVASYVVRSAQRYVREKVRYHS
jgi:RNA polymerase sigma factor (sigma-70 family)